MRLLLLLLLISACASERAPDDCKDVCRREASCVDQVAEDGEQDDEDQNKFDQSECIAACAALKRDDIGKDLVVKYVECAKAAKDCAALLACE